MAGTSQASNLTGLLGSIGGTIGEMGAAGKQYVDTFRDLQAPGLNMDDPESMRRYGEYLRRNGRQEEAMAMMSKAQDRRMALRQNEGQAKIAAIAGNMASMPDGPAKQAALKQIYQLAEKHEVPGMQLNQILHSQGIDVGKLANDVARTGIARYGAETDRMQVENQAEQFGISLAEEQRQFDTQMLFKESELDETRRINSHRIWRGQEEIRQGDESLSLEEARVEIAKDLANEEISMGQFRRIMMGNEDARAEDMHDIEKQVKEAQITVALANAGYTEAQTADTLYELGFKRDTEQLRTDAMMLQNQQTQADIKVARANEDYIQERTKAVTAEVELGRDRYNLEARRQAWDMGMDELEMQINQGLANSQIQLRGAQIDEINNSIRSSVLRDEILVAQAESEKISQAYIEAYKRDIDLSNPTAIANARKAFIGQFGSEFAMDFDEAIQQRIKVQELIEDTGQNAALRADAKPKTVSQLEAAGMSPQEIDQYKLLTDPAEKNQYVQTWAKRHNTPEQGGAPTKALMDIYGGTANRIRLDVFGWDFPFGMDGDAIENDIALAMASAAASGKSPNQVMIAGIEATYPHLQDQGSATSAQTVEGYRRKYEGDQ